MSLTPLNSDRIATKRARRLETAPMSVCGILSRSWTRKSRKTAITAMCLECVGFDRKAITECAAYAYPLWKSRPYQVGTPFKSEPVVPGAEKARTEGAPPCE